MSYPNHKGDKALNINKQEMTLAFLNREDPLHLNRFIGFLDQLATFCVKKLKINDMYRDDIKQIAVEHAFRKMELYDPNTGSAAYSYFYKVIYMRCLYELRADKQKRLHAPSICSLDKFQNLDGECEEPINIENIHGYVSINGKAYEKRTVLKAICDAKAMIRKSRLTIRKNRLFSIKENIYVELDDELLKTTCYEILEKKMMRERQYQ